MKDFDTNKHYNLVVDATIDKVDVDYQSTEVPIINVTFDSADSAAFSVKFAGVSPAMFAAFAAWCSYMSTKLFAERDLAEAMKERAARKLIIPTILPGGTH